MIKCLTNHNLANTQVLQIEHLELVKNYLLGVRLLSFINVYFLHLNYQFIH